jgi:hypothetical protein
LEEGAVSFRILRIDNDMCAVDHEANARRLRKLIITDVTACCKIPIAQNDKDGARQVKCLRLRAYVR